MTWSKKSVCVLLGKVGFYHSKENMIDFAYTNHANSEDVTSKSRRPIMQQEYEGDDKLQKPSETNSHPVLDKRETHLIQLSDYNHVP